jgi:hypothetical protein
MIILTSTDTLRVVTGSAGSVDVHAAWMDGPANPTPGRQNSQISSAATTTVVASPGSGVFRAVKTLLVRNSHASNSNLISIEHSDGTLIPRLFSATLGPLETLAYDDQTGFSVRDAQGRLKANEAAGSLAVAVGTRNVVVLGSDVINNNATANTIADITGLSFSVTAGEIYWFRMGLLFNAAAGTTGARFSVNGPASPTQLGYRVGIASVAAAGSDGETTGFGNAYDQPTGAAATSPFTTGNFATVEGFIQPSANGTLVGRVASEISSSAITVKAGSFLEWMRTV